MQAEINSNNYKLQIAVSQIGLYKVIYKIRYFDNWRAVCSL